MDIKQQVIAVFLAAKFNETSIIPAAATLFIGSLIFICKNNA
ncbi:MAG: hypothetical protein V4660_08685 [Pseudomonadota bacterium]